MNDLTNPELSAAWQLLTGAYQYRAQSIALMPVQPCFVTEMQDPGLPCHLPAAEDRRVILPAISCHAFCFLTDEACSRHSGSLSQKAQQALPRTQP